MRGQNSRRQTTPLLEGADPEMVEHNKAVFKGFFSTLKSYDRYIKFVLLTGVTKFSKVSIFSDLNQLNDISLDREYSGICGITEEEIDDGSFGVEEAYVDLTQEDTDTQTKTDIEDISRKAQFRILVKDFCERYNYTIELYGRKQGAWAFGSSLFEYLKGKGYFNDD